MNKLAARLKLVSFIAGAVGIAINAFDEYNGYKRSHKQPLGFYTLDRK